MSRRADMHRWFVERRAAAAGDDAAAVRYEELAAVSVERHDEYLSAAAESRASAQWNRDAMSRRLAGTYSPTAGERAIAKYDAKGGER